MDYYNITQELCRIRDMIELIAKAEKKASNRMKAKGEIEWKNLSNRPISFKEARATCGLIVARLNKLAVAASEREHGSLRDTCDKCGLPFHRDEKYVSFGSGSIPLHSISLKIRAEWCPTPHCSETKVLLIPNKEGRAMI